MDSSSPAVIEAVPVSKPVPSSNRQHRSAELKRKIVEETLAPGASVARVARAHGVNANQVFEWRRLYGEGRLGAPIATASRLLPVRVAEAAAIQSIVPPAVETGVADGEAGGTQKGAIHLELRKARLRIEGNVDPAVLRLVLKALLG